MVRVDDGQDIICFPKLSELHLLWLPRLASVYNNQVEFPQLKILNVSYCGNLDIVIRCAMLHGFQNLEHINISRCDRLRRVFHHSSPAESTMVFPALKKLWLERLRNLKSFLSYDKEILEIDDSKSNTLFTTTVFRSFQQLEEIQVERCNLLKGIVEDGGGTHGINPNTPISLLQLRYLTLSHLPNLQNCGIFASYMPALSVVEVDSCAISSLFTCSAFRNLQNLTNLRVKRCHMLEQILADDVDDETPGPSEMLISLPLLKTIQLENLHGLKSFSSSSSFTFSMPALYKIEAYDCPCMDKFAFLQITATLIEGDLNDSIYELVRESEQDDELTEFKDCLFETLNKLEEEDDEAEEDNE